ncbi:hypothetical protein BC830DRAFT_1129573 [Chytriomyces sp. MP71]|nr:hypothetical protein BC830DRAFT_1129573 [Chytriomyces sp. MP71]
MHSLIASALSPSVSAPNPSSETVFASASQASLRIVWNALLARSLRQNNVATSDDIFRDMFNKSPSSLNLPTVQPATDTYNTLLRHALYTNNIARVQSLLSTMNNTPHCSPNLRTFHILIKHTAKMGMPLQTRRYILQLFDLTESSQSEPGKLTESSFRLTQETIHLVVQAYIDIGDIDAAYQLLSEASLARVVTTNSSAPSQLPQTDENLLSDPALVAKSRLAVMRAYARHPSLKGSFERVLELYHQLVLQPIPILSSPHTAFKLAEEDSLVWSTEQKHRWRRRRLQRDARANLVEALVRHGYLAEAAGVLSGGTSHGGRLMEVVMAVMARRRREAARMRRDEETRNVQKQGDKVTRVPLATSTFTAAHDARESFVIRLFDTNNTITRTTLTSTGALTTTLTNESLAVPVLSETSSATSLPFTGNLQVLLLNSLRTQPNQSHDAITNRLLAYLHECINNKKHITLIAFQLVLNHIRKPIPGATIASQYDALKRLASLRAAHILTRPVDPQIHLNLLLSLESRANAIRTRHRRALKSGTRASSLTPPLHDPALLALQSESWDLFTALLAASTRKPPPRAFPAMLSLHRGTTAGIDRVLSAAVAHVDAFPVRAWILLLRHAAATRRWALVEGFWDTIATTRWCGDARVLRAGVAAALRFRKWDFARRAIVGEDSEKSPEVQMKRVLEGAPGWFVRRWRCLLGAVVEGNVRKMERVLQRMKKRGGELWRGAGERGKRRRHILVRGLVLEGMGKKELASGPRSTRVEDEWAKLMNTMAELKAS